MANLLAAAAMLCAAAALVTSAAAATCANPTKDVTLTKPLVAGLVARLQQLISSVVATDTEGKRYNPLVAGFVRLAFHSCAVSGCCSNYVNLADPLNNGLAPAVSAAVGLWQQIQLNAAYKGLSQADFFALAGIAAVEVATGYKKSVVFRYGRRDFCSGDDLAALGVEIPSRSLGTNATLNYFRRKFNFSADETVAIMGAHSLGGVHDFSAEHKLVARWWDGNPARLNNTYYKLLAYDNTWRQVYRRYAGLSYPLYEWNRVPTRPTRLMLNSDVGLEQQVNVYDKTTGAATCVTQCARAPTSPAVHAYARNGQRFLDDFALAFGKMIENGCTNLKDVGN